MSALVCIERPKAKRLAWTPEVIAELQHHLRYCRTYKEIGRALGASETAVKHKVHVLGLSRPDLKGYRLWLHLKGRPRSPETIEKCAAATRERMKDPAKRQQLRDHLQNPAIREKYAAGVKRYNDERRGFSVPHEKMDDYRLMRRKGFSATEAGRSLGILPPAIRIAGRPS